MKKTFENLNVGDSIYSLIIDDPLKEITEYVIDEIQFEEDGNRMWIYAKSGGQMFSWLLRDHGCYYGKTVYEGEYTLLLATNIQDLINDGIKICKENANRWNEHLKNIQELSKTYEKKTRI